MGTRNASDRHHIDAFSFYSIQENRMNRLFGSSNNHDNGIEWRPSSTSSKSASSNTNTIKTKTTDPNPNPPELTLHLNQPVVAPIKLKVQPSTAQLPCLLLSLVGQGFHSSCIHQNYILTIWGRLLSCRNDSKADTCYTHTHIKKRHDQNSSC